MKPIFLLLLFFSCTAALLQGMEEGRKPVSDSDSPKESLKKRSKQEEYNSEKKAAASAGDTDESCSDDDASIESTAPIPASNLEDFRTASKRHPKAARFILIEDEEGMLFLQLANAKEIPDENEEDENRVVIDFLRKKLLEQHPYLNIKEFFGDLLLSGKIPLSSKMLQSIFEQLASRKSSSQQNQYDFMSDPILSSSSSSFSRPSAARESPDDAFFKWDSLSDDEDDSPRAQSSGSFQGHHVEKVAASGTKRGREESPLPFYGIDEFIREDKQASLNERKKIAKFEENLPALKSTDALDIPWEPDKEEKQPYENQLALKYYTESLNEGKSPKEAAIFAATKIAEQDYTNLLQKNLINNHANEELLKKKFSVLEYCYWSSDAQMWKQVAEIRDALLDKYYQDRRHSALRSASIAAEQCYDKLQKEGHDDKYINTELFVIICSTLKQQLGSLDRKAFEQAAQIKKEIFDMHTPPRN